MKLKRKCMSILVAISIAVMSVSCENINNSNEIENYAAEEIEFNYDSETKLLKQYPTFSKGESIEFTYDFNCKEYEELLKKYPIEEIAGEGSEFERVLRLTHEYSGRLTHKSDYDNAIAENALALLEYSLDQPDNGINCRAKAEILNEMCLALGIYSRRVSINPYSSIDNDSHVVNEIFDTQRNKWIMVDMTTDSYVIDKNDTPLSLLELRQCAVDGAYCALVTPDGKIEAGEERGYGTNSLTYYMKNLFFFNVCLYQGFGIRDNVDEVVYFVPEGFDIKKRIVSRVAHTLEFIKQDSQYEEWVKECEEELEACKKVSFIIGDISALEERI